MSQSRSRILAQRWSGGGSGIPHIPFQAGQGGLNEGMVDALRKHHETKRCVQKGELQAWVRNRVYKAVVLLALLFEVGHPEFPRPLSSFSASVYSFLPAFLLAFFHSSSICLSSPPSSLPVWPWVPPSTLPALSVILASPATSSARLPVRWPSRRRRPASLVS